MPELYFVQGAAGYLRYRVARDQDTSPPEATVITALNALEMFRKTAGDESSEASGVSSELSSMLHFLHNGNGDIEQSVADAHQAAVSEPESGAARNLNACMRIWQDW